MEAMAVEIGKAFLSSAVDFLISEFGSALVEGFFEHRKHDDKELLEKLTETLNVVNGLLDDAEEKQITLEAVRIWLDAIKDAVYEAEDLLLTRLIMKLDHHARQYELEKKVSCKKLLLVLDNVWSDNQAQ